MRNPDPADRPKGTSHFPIIPKEQLEAVAAAVGKISEEPSASNLSTALGSLLTSDNPQVSIGQVMAAAATVSGPASFGAGETVDG